MLPSLQAGKNKACLRCKDCRQKRCCKMGVSMLIVLWHYLAKVKRKEVGLMQNKDWSYLLGQKIGMLKVLEIYPPGVISIRPKKKTSVARCVCECGTECYRDVSNLARRQGMSCGGKECKHKIMSLTQTRRQATNKSKATAQKPAEKFLKDEEPIITKKLKNKYVCPFPFPGCVRSEVCHVCCWECDKECKQCSNNPQLCGARRLR